MNCPVVIRLGLNGTEIGLDPITIDSRVINCMSAYAGSFHILSMGRHYHDYVLSSVEPPPFRHYAGLPRAYPFLALSNKLRAAGVTGNIGEGVCGIVANTTFGLPLGHFLHVKLRPNMGYRKTPDFMFRIGPRFDPAVIPTPPIPISSSPIWWPVESKARTTQSDVNDAIRNEALPQLASFWYSIRTRFRDAVGFGMAIGFAYEVSPRIQITIFTPDRIANLRRLLNSYQTYDKFREGIKANPRLIREMLHGS